MAGEGRVTQGVVWAPVRNAVVMAAGLLLAASCSAPELGPVDGEGLAPTDLERVRVGDEAPDFSLLAYSGDVLTLSDYRRQKDVILVFYRGHW